MYLVKKIEQYDNDDVFFCEPIKNNIMEQSSFIRIIYSNSIFILNGIYLLITLNDITCEKYYTKYKCTFNITDNQDIIERIKNIEESILNKYSNTNKIKQLKIYDQFKNGNFKIFTDTGSKSICSFILKVSGIWETHNNYGLTYKFTKIS